jgi:hypothetical protein
MSRSFDLFDRLHSMRWRVTAVVMGALVALIILVSSASAYMHQTNCQGGLRFSLYPGNYPGDADISQFSALYGLGGFRYWGEGYHPNNNEHLVIQWVRFNKWYSNGWFAHDFWCSGNDDNFNDGPY